MTLTPDEHTARAMLMGRIYIEWLHVYVDPETWRSSQLGGSPPDIWVDADSLEEVPHNDKLSRLVNRATDKLASGEYAPDPETYKYVFARMAGVAR